LAAGAIPLLPGVLYASEPTTPDGQSNSFVANTNSVGYGETTILMATSVPLNGVVPAVISLGEVTPNPFNPRTTISFNTGRSGPVELSIYDVRGHNIKDLASRVYEVGQYSLPWDGRDNSGFLAPTGVYLVRIKGEFETDSKKITLAK
jgi:hypothetical protein